jgi:colicin import membrane protein
MPGFAREHLRPLLGSAGLHLALLAALAGAALNWTSSQPPVQLAIQGVVVDARSLPKSALTGAPRPQPRPEPVVQEAQPPQPVPVPEDDAHARQKAAEDAAAARAKAEAEARVAAERRQAAEQQARERAAADAEKRKQVDEQAARRKQAEEDARRKASEESERKKAEAAKAEQDARVKAEHEAELRRQLAAEEEGAAVARSGVVDEYRALLVQTIERNWIRPPSARAGLECTLYVSQAPGGTVVDVRLGACNGDQSVRESIVNAVYRASPLPAPRDPRAFERKLEIVFRPTE